MQILLRQPLSPAQSVSYSHLFPVVIGFKHLNLLSESFLHVNPYTQSVTELHLSPSYCPKHLFPIHSPLRQSSFLSQGNVGNLLKFSFSVQIEF